MGLFDWFTGTKRPEDGVVPRSPQEVHQALLALNRPDVAFVVRDGGPEGVDLVSEWRIIDPAWHQYFAAVNMTKSFQVRMRFDAGKAEVRSVDQALEVDWVHGVPQLSFPEVSRGQTKQVERTWTVGRDKDGGVELESRASFSSDDLKSPLQKTVTSLGWTWRGVAFGKL